MAIIYRIETDELTKMLLQEEENKDIIEDISKAKTKGKKNGKSNATKHQEH